MYHQLRLLGAVLVLISVLSGSSLAAPSGGPGEVVGQSTTISPARLPIFREAEDDTDYAESTGIITRSSKIESQDPSVSSSKRRDNRDSAQHGSAQASDKLMKAFRAFRKSESYKQGIMDVELLDDNIYEWNVKLFFPDPATNLHQDLKDLKQAGRGEDYILFRVTFTGDFPNSPPFVRVLSPAMGRETFPTLVQSGGNICAQILSRQGWQSDYTIEGMFLVLADLLITEGERVALDQSKMKDYTGEKARMIYEQLEELHGQLGW